MAKEIRNIGASVRARLLNLSKANGQSFDLVLTRFALERLLFRLSQSPHADRFVLKGAMRMMSWFDDPHRGTRDLDLLGFGDPSEDAMLATFRDILSLDVADGVVFDPDTLRVDRIREELDYGGLRLRAIAVRDGNMLGPIVGDDPGREIVLGRAPRKRPRITEQPLKLLGCGRRALLSDSGHCAKIAERGHRKNSPFLP